MAIKEGEASALVIGEPFVSGPLDSSATAEVAMVGTEAEPPGFWDGAATGEVALLDEAEPAPIDEGEASATVALSNEGGGELEPHDEGEGNVQLQPTADGDLAPVGYPSEPEIPLEVEAEGDKTEPVIFQTFGLRGNILFDSEGYP